jgi:nucleoside-diphosphate-sugar epimerase
MRAVVTGGAGFLGSHLCDYLLAKGWDVLAIDNLVTGTKVNVQHLQNNLDSNWWSMTSLNSLTCRARWITSSTSLLLQARSII